MVESLCANTTLMLGETLTGISKDMDLTSHRWRFSRYFDPSILLPVARVSWNFLVSGFLLAFVPALLLSTFPQWFPSGCFPRASSRATPMLWRWEHFANRSTSNQNITRFKAVFYGSQVREIQQLAWLLWSFWWRLELLRELSMSYMGRSFSPVSTWIGGNIFLPESPFTSIWPARLRELHLRPSGHPRHQLCGRWPCRKAHLQQGLCKWEESSGFVETFKPHADTDNNIFCSATWGPRTMEWSCQMPTRNMLSTRCLADLHPFYLVCWEAFIKIFVHMLQLVGAAFGAAGQRCMALTTAVMVWIFVFLIGSFPWLPCSLHLIALVS